MQSKRYYSISKLGIILLFSFFSLTACSPKVGCPSAEAARAGMVNRKGELSTKGGKSQLFSEKGGMSMRKARKVRAKQRRKKYSKRRN